MNRALFAGAFERAVAAGFQPPAGVGQQAAARLAQLHVVLLATAIKAYHPLYRPFSRSMRSILFRLYGQQLPPMIGEHLQCWIFLDISTKNRLICTILLSLYQIEVLLFVVLGCTLLPLNSVQDELSHISRDSQELRNV